MDDEKLVRWFVRQALKERARVSVAPSAERALERLRTKAFDGLLTDIRLPGMDGLELVRRARELQPKLRIFVMTAFDQGRAPAAAFQVRADAYLPKPFSIELLRDMLASHLGATGAIS